MTSPGKSKKVRVAGTQDGREEWEGSSLGKHTGPDPGPRRPEPGNLAFILNALGRFGRTVSGKMA